MMKPVIFILLLFCSACSNRIELENIEQREHGLSFIKETNKLVHGEVVRRVDGKIVELHNYKQGKAIGNFYLYGMNGETLSHGFGVDAKKYEAKLPNTDLTHSFLSINIIGSQAFATLYLDKESYFEDANIMLSISNEVFREYAGKYPIVDILIYDQKHEYTISKAAAESRNYNVDTMKDRKRKTVFFR